jgi:hypothetical protein
MTLGMYLLWLMSARTSALLDAVYMLVLGMFIGCVMQVLVIIVPKRRAAQRARRRDVGRYVLPLDRRFFRDRDLRCHFLVLIGNLARHLHGVPLPAGFSAVDATPERRQPAARRRSELS